MSVFPPLRFSGCVFSERNLQIMCNRATQKSWIFMLPYVEILVIIWNILFLHHNYSLINFELICIIVFSNWVPDWDCFTYLQYWLRVIYEPLIHLIGARSICYFFSLTFVIYVMKVNSYSYIKEGYPSFKTITYKPLFSFFNVTWKMFLHPDFVQYTHIFLTGL